MRGKSPLHFYMDIVKKQTLYYGKYQYRVDLGAINGSKSVRISKFRKLYNEYTKDLCVWYDSHKNVARTMTFRDYALSHDTVILFVQNDATLNDLLTICNRHSQTPTSITKCEQSGVPNVIYHVAPTFAHRIYLILPKSDDDTYYELLKWASMMGANIRCDHQDCWRGHTGRTVRTMKWIDVKTDEDKTAFLLTFGSNVSESVEIRKRPW